ncbi:Extracellular matrix protein PelF, glycosyltransferase, group 1 [hydrothermal vent metagenome]|uniref:Extracellular matrix protein PelF, glycosyltransferase, group 1 n=1 Tax=hydrothermal vent metagenome TaxID=652676 RepID=A0A1W1ECX1_9ZZZZ
MKTIYLKRAEYVDIMILAEGTYPYVRGGVSSWIHQLMTELPMFSFGICFMGSRPDDYDKINYEFPPNLLHLEVHYMFSEVKESIFAYKNKKNPEIIAEIKKLHTWFKSQKGEIPQKVRDVSFYLNEASEEYFLHDIDVWDYMTKKYEENCPEVPFVDYFWSLRNMHKPIWLIASIVKNFPKCGLFHSPSTGYAGFLGAMASNHTDKPLFISEHGIYTRERKIDLLNATWINYKKPLLLQNSNDENYIKQMWINFFFKIADFSYSKSEKIFSLFPQAKQVQADFGADVSKLEVIPNGVNVDLLSEAYENRKDVIPHVITLIGRVVAIKDIKTFIRAIKLAVDKIPDVEGWIVGPMDEDIEYAQECKDMVITLGLEKNIKFLGFQNIMEILPLTGIQTLTSISEGMPLVILEGFAAGVPCVATDVGSCKNLIEGALDEEDIAIGKAGIVTGIANPVSLAEAYIELFNDENLWKEMQNNGRERVEKYYRQEMFLEKYKNYYNKALN